MEIDPGCIPIEIFFYEKVIFLPVHACFCNFSFNKQFFAKEKTAATTTAKN